MLKRNELHFTRRSILTAAQLRAIERFPQEILRIKYKDFANGIISGVDFVQRGDEIFTTEGLVKIGNLFYLAEEINLSALTENLKGHLEYHFVLSKPNRTSTENVTTEKIFLDVQPLEGFTSELEFGRFTSGGGINLPKLDAEDLLRTFTSKNRLNLLNVPYSVHGGTTFHPYIFRAILHKLKLKENPSPADIALMIHLADFKVATIPALEIYVKQNSAKWQGDSRKNIFESVLNAVKAEWKISVSTNDTTTPDRKPPMPTGRGSIMV